MKTLVTGGAGFIGSHVIDALRARGDDVVCIDSLDPGVHHAPPAYLRSDVDYCFTDLRWWRPDARFADVEAIVHLAALGGVSRAGKEPGNVIAANCVGTARLMEAARAWPHLASVVHASSFSVYGSNYTYRCPRCGAERDGTRQREDLDANRFEVRCAACGADACIVPITEAASPHPLETYGASKYMQELAWRGFDRCPVHVVRFSSVYGTRLRHDDGEATIIAKLIGWIANGVSPTLFEDGCQIRDWVYVGDVVGAALRLLGEHGSPRLVNVCSGVPTRLAEACDQIARAVGTDVEATVAGGYRPGDMRHCLGDASALRALLGRDPVTFRDGIPMAIA